MKPLWTCPSCGERFISPRLWHSCGRYTYDALFAKADPHVRRIFNRVAALARACGPVRIYPQKTRIVIQARIRFAGGTPRKRAFIAGFLLPRTTRSPRFMREIDGLSRHYKAVQIVLRSERDVDVQFGRWMARAYRIGVQEHLGKAEGKGKRRRG
jgi:hypothetical protein